jgi:hypothetical protein
MIVNSKGASIAVAISAILSTHVFAADPTVEAFEAALKIDGAEYAKAYNLSNEEGFQRLKWQAAASDVIERLRDQYQGRLADLYIEHLPTQRVVVRLKGSDPVALHSFAVGDETINVEFQPGAAHTHAQLQDIITNNFAVLKSSFPTLQGVGPSSHGDVIITIFAERSTPEAQAKQTEAANKLLGVPVRIMMVPAKLLRQPSRTE